MMDDLQTPPAFPTPAHERLNILVGVWDTTITLLNEDGGEGDTSSAFDAYRWTSNGHFLVHDVDATMGGTSFQSIEIIGVDAEGRSYVTRSYDADGAMNDFTSAIDGRRWTIVGETQRFAGEFSADGQTISGRWEQKADGVWWPFVNVTLRKRPPA